MLTFLHELPLHRPFLAHGGDVTLKRKKLSERILPDYTRGEEIFNMASHATGVALGIVATVLCVVAAARGHNPMGVVTGAIFGASMILLYTISSVYHGLSPLVLGKKVLRVLDHCTIYLLIAGSYTPLALCALRGVNPKMGWTLFGVVLGRGGHRYHPHRHRHGALQGVLHDLLPGHGLVRGGDPGSL